MIQYFVEHQLAVQRTAISPAKLQFISKD